MPLRLAPHDGIAAPQSPTLRNSGARPHSAGDNVRAGPSGLGRDPIGDDVGAGPSGRGLHPVRDDVRAGRRGRGLHAAGGDVRARPAGFRPNCRNPGENSIQRTPDCIYPPGKGWLPSALRLGGNRRRHGQGQKENDCYETGHMPSFRAGSTASVIAGDGACSVVSILTRFIGSSGSPTAGP